MSGTELGGAVSLLSTGSHWLHPFFFKWEEMVFEGDTTKNSLTLLLLFHSALQWYQKQNLPWEGQLHCPPCQTTYKQTILVSGFWRRVVDGQVRGGGPVCHFRNDRFDVHGVRRSRVPDLPARAATAAAADQPAGQRQAL